MKPVYMLLITGWPINSNKIILILFKTFIKPLEKILKGILVPDRKPQICPITALVKTNFIKQVILEILLVCLWLKFFIDLYLNKLAGFRLDTIEYQEFDTNFRSSLLIQK